jgi:hypothetical protein
MPKKMMSNSQSIFQQNFVNSGEHIVRHESDVLQSMDKMNEMNLDINNTLEHRAKSVTKSQTMLKTVPEKKQFIPMNQNIENRLVKSYCKIHNEADVHKFLQRFPGLRDKQ